MKRRDFLRTTAQGLAGTAASAALHSRSVSAAESERKGRQPNILFAMADDWSWVHTGAYGDKVVKTPAFDRVAREGALFSNAFCAAPQCSPNRASILTGRNIWQLREAGTHASLFPNTFTVYPDSLEQAGYRVGYTGKPWSPGSWEEGGRSRNPAGPEFNRRKTDTPRATGVYDIDYAGNFKDLFTQKPTDRPFCFWYGSFEPHRKYEKGSGLKSGKRLEDVVVPPALPDTPEIRSDLLDYYVEIEWFDRQLGEMMRILEEAGELDNTIIVATSDNGMPFPHAKANLYEYGTHMPLAIRWPTHIQPGRVIDDFVTSIDFAPTFLEAAGLPPVPEMTGQSLMQLLTSTKSGQIDPKRTFVLTGRERHSHSRYDNLGYPSRAIRTRNHLYIRNHKPERWPVGAPDGFHDLDNGPTKSFMIENWNTERYREKSERAFGKRPAEELFAIQTDPACLKNLADDPAHATVKRVLRAELERLLEEQKDPRALGQGDVFESYPRFLGMRDTLGGFKERATYNPKYQK